MRSTEIVVTQPPTAELRENYSRIHLPKTERADDGMVKTKMYPNSSIARWNDVRVGVEEAKWRIRWSTLSRSINWGEQLEPIEETRRQAVEEPIRWRPSHLTLAEPSSSHEIISVECNITTIITQQNLFRFDVHVFVIFVIISTPPLNFNENSFITWYLDHQWYAIFCQNTLRSHHILPIVPIPPMQKRYWRIDPSQSKGFFFSKKWEDFELLNLSSPKNDKLVVA